MKSSQYFLDWSSSRATVKLLFVCLLFMCLAVAVLGGALAMKTETVVLIPPNLEERTSVSQHEASEAYQVSWGLYVATLLGNITPSTAPFLSDQLGKNMSPALYDTVLKQIADQAAQIKADQIKVSFAPKLANYVPETKTVIVTGDLTVRDMRGEERVETRTYEMGFIVRNYRPLLDSLKVTSGTYRRQLAQPAAETSTTSPLADASDARTAEGG